MVFGDFDGLKCCQFLMGEFQLKESCERGVINEIIGIFNGDAAFALKIRDFFVEEAEEIVIQVLCLLELNIEIAILMLAGAGDDGIALGDREGIELIGQKLIEVDFVSCADWINHPR